jgi:SAM-dependent methyltransferase
VEASKWISDHVDLLPIAGSALDLACGGGRHTQYLASRGFSVTSVDIDISKTEALSLLNVTAMQFDLEEGKWPFEDMLFDAIIVTNYLWRPLFPHIISALKLGGIVLYETFAIGNEEFGRPSNPDFLLAEGELLQQFASLDVLDYRHTKVEEPKPAIKQAIAAKRIQ